MVVPIITAAATAVSVGMQLWGANQQKKAQREQGRIAGEQAQLAKQQLGLQELQLNNTQRGSQFEYEGFKQQTAIEKQAEEVRRTAMTTDASRRMLENVRLYQRARSMGLTTATSQGAQGGSGLMGAYGQASGQIGWNVGSITQQLGFGESLFQLNRQSTLAKEDLANNLYLLQQGNYNISRQGFGLAAKGADLNAQMVAAGGKAAEGAGISAVGSVIGSLGPTLGKIGGNIFGGSGGGSSQTLSGSSYGFDWQGPV
jgi:hypothetical protein